MRNPRDEIYRLKTTLGFRGVPDDAIDDICDSAAYEMEQLILDAVKSAYESAVRAGVELDADEFVAELKPVDVGNSFKILTDSGRTDFSEPPFPMLPKLIQNGQVAKDGSRYKVIPVGAKSSGSQHKKVQFDVLDVFTQINKDRQELKARRREDRKGNKLQAPDPWASADIFADMVKTARNNSRDSMAVQPLTNTAATNVKVRAGKAQGEEFVMETQMRKPTERVHSSEVSFRTASSKQDPSKQWVKPAKQLNMSSLLMEINSKLENDIHSIITTTINKYEGTM